MIPVADVAGMALLATVGTGAPPLAFLRAGVAERTAATGVVDLGLMVAATEARELREIVGDRDFSPPMPEPAAATTPDEIAGDAARLLTCAVGAAIGAARGARVGVVARGRVTTGVTDRCG